MLSLAEIESLNPRDRILCIFYQMMLSRLKCFDRFEVQPALQPINKLSTFTALSLVVSFFGKVKLYLGVIVPSSEGMSTGEVVVHHWLRRTLGRVSCVEDELHESILVSEIWDVMLPLTLSLSGVKEDESAPKDLGSARNCSHLLMEDEVSLLLKQECECEYFISCVYAWSELLFAAYLQIQVGNIQ